VFGDVDMSRLLSGLPTRSLEDAAPPVERSRPATPAFRDRQRGRNIWLADVCHCEDGSPRRRLGLAVEVSHVHGVHGSTIFLV
jgi:hypothetical protein